VNDTATTKTKQQTMTKRIQRIAPLQLGIVLAVLYGVLSLIAVPFILIASLAGAKAHGGLAPFGGGMIVAILIPFLYAALGFIGGIITAAIYNLIASWTGGIELTLADAPNATPPAL
jgi:hypothetical protein